MHNIVKKRNTVKNSVKAELELPNKLDLLNRWTIPKVEPKLIYELGTFEKLGLDGLPTLFAERIRKTLRGNRMNIPYEQYTYGKLIGTCVQEGLALCNEIKLNQQIKRQRLTERNQLGQFCSQFGVDIPSKKQIIKEESSKPYYKKK